MLKPRLNGGWCWGGLFVLFGGCVRGGYVHFFFWVRGGGLDALGGKTQTGTTGIKNYYYHERLRNNLSRGGRRGEGYQIEGSGVPQKARQGVGMS